MANASRVIIAHAHDKVPSLLMLVPLLCLCVGSIWFGYVFKDLFVGMGTDFWSTAIFISFKNVSILESEYMPAVVKLIPVVFSILGMPYPTSS